ncbi:MAG: stage V sporulation protein AD [Erysipelotrichaceae bacterium]|nr:stage V sporulation protein AD [Erysipelotrichaceae bacterium]
MNYLTLSFNNVFIRACSSVSGPKEKSGPLGNFFDYSFENERANQKTFEKGEVEMLKTSLEILLKKAKLPIDKISLCIGGDLSNQIALSNLIAKDLPLSFIGVYSACSTLILSMNLASVFVSSSYLDNVLCFSSSNYGTSERQFRYPLEYGIFKKDTTTITVSGAASCIISNEKSRIRVNHSTFGKVEDVMWDNVSDMGSPMAYGAYETIKHHLKNTSSKIEDFDLILTGDLSTLGSKILKELFLEDSINLYNHQDAGNLIYGEDKSKFMGGSGSACIGLTSFGYIFKKMINKEYKKVLLVGTGALHSKTSVQQNNVIPVVAHAIEIEVVE